MHTRKILITEVAGARKAFFFRGRIVEILGEQGPYYNFWLLEDDWKEAKKVNPSWIPEKVFSGWIKNAIMVPDNAY